MSVDINLNNVAGLIVKTEAEWALDSTPYANNYFLVSSDAFFFGTNHRKFKLSNGVDVWADMDYMPDFLSEFINHINNTDNPHETTKGQVGLGNVDNLQQQPINTQLTEISAIDGVAGDWMYNEGGVWVKKSTLESRILLGNYTKINADVNETHTGDTNEFLLTYFDEIDPAILPIGTKDAFEWEIFRSHNGSTGNKFFRIYLNTSNSLVGATLIAEHRQVTNTNLSSSHQRRIRLVNSLTSQRIMNITTGNQIASSIFGGTGVFQTVTLNFGVKLFVLYTIQNSTNAADTQTVNSILMKHLKAAA